MKDRRRQKSDEDVSITFDDINIDMGAKHTAQLVHIMRAIFAQGVQLMAQIDEVRAAQAATKSTLDVVSAKSDEILAEVKAGGAGQDLSDIVAAAIENADAAEAVRVKVQAIDDELDGVPAAR